MTPSSYTAWPYGPRRWTKAKNGASAAHADDAADDAARTHADDRWQRFVALPIPTRRVLVACAAWLITAYIGVALLAAGVDALLMPERHWSAGLVMTLGGVALAMLGLVRARSGILACRSDS